MAKINVQIDTESKSAALSVDDQIIMDADDFWAEKYSYVDADGNKQERISFSYSKREEGSDGSSTTRTFRWSAEDSDASIREVTDDDSTVASALAETIKH
jgi:hypothetical protein